MQFERIRKTHKKEILIGGLITLGIVLAITIVTTKAKYKVTQDIPLVSGNINYKPYDFKIMAMYQSDDGTNYTEINTMPASGYVINEDKTYCTIDNQAQVKGKIKTINGNVAISNLSKSDKCYLYFDKEKTAGDIIIANATKGTGTPTFRKTACSSGCEETTVGTYTISDGMYGGTTTYWRGDVTDNYVRFANFCWRIVRVNGDGSIRLIYDGTTCHANGTSTAESIAVSNVSYNTNADKSEYVGWTYEVGKQRPSNNATGTLSNAKIRTDNWYSANIGSKELYASKVADGKYCNDRSVEKTPPSTWGSSYVATWSSTGSNFVYLPAIRSVVDYSPILNCDEKDIYILKIGLITSDEVMYAGGRGTSNTSYYLFNGQNYWTMSPYYWVNGSVDGQYVVSSGSLSCINISVTTHGLRPVINLRSDITFSSGNGTLDDPYVVS